MCVRACMKYVSHILHTAVKLGPPLVQSIESFGCGTWGMVCSPKAEMSCLAYAQTNQGCQLPNLGSGSVMSSEMSMSLRELTASISVTRLLHMLQAIHWSLGPSVSSSHPVLTSSHNIPFVGLLTDHATESYILLPRILFSIPSPLPEPKLAGNGYGLRPGTSVLER